jgi:hypothetical protein
MQVRSERKQDGTPDAILHPASRSLFSYWNRLRGPRTAPHRQEMELRPIAPILPVIGVIERHASPNDDVHRRPGRHHWRLVGTGIARLWGNGLTGTEVAADWPDVYRHSLAHALDGVCDRHQSFVARLKGVTAGGEAVGLELFAAPVVANVEANVEASDGAPVQAWCSVVAVREPAWLGRIPIAYMELSNLIAVGMDRLPGEIASHRRRSHQSERLKLIQGGRVD